MFGLFSKKKYEFKCPICDFEYNFKLDPKKVTEFDYPHTPTYTKTAKLSDFKCEFCKSPFTVVMTETGKVFAVDEKWEMYRNDYDAKCEKIYEEISDIEDNAFDNDGEEITLTPAQLKKAKALNAKVERLEESNNNKEERYYDKQSRWQDKQQNRK